jgi:hypothetical protein
MVTFILRIWFGYPVFALSEVSLSDLDLFLQAIPIASRKISASIGSPLMKVRTARA